MQIRPLEMRHGLKALCQYIRSEAKNTIPSWRIARKPNKFSICLKAIPNWRVLAYIEQYDGSRLSITMMLAATDFNSFASLVERHYFSDLEYLIRIPVPGFAADMMVEENLLATFGACLPTAAEFLSGTPFYIPNCAIDLEFHHLDESASQKYKWLGDNKRQLEDERQHGAEPQKQEVVAIEHNRTLNQLLAIADARKNAASPKRSGNRLALLYVGILLSIVIACGFWLVFHG